MYYYYIYYYDILDTLSSFVMYVTRGYHLID